MVFLQLLRKQYNLDVGTSQVLQDQLVMNSSQIVLFYQDHVQLWNLHVQKLIYKSHISGSIWFWSVPTPISKTSFSFVCLQNCEPYLGTFNFEGNKVEKLCDLPKDQSNFNATFYFESSGYIGVEERANQHKLLIWNGKSLESIKLDENALVEQYNKNSVSIFSSQTRTTGFQLHTGIQSKKYTLQIPDGSICSIKQFSSTEAAIGVIKDKVTNVFLYNLTAGKKDRQQTLEFQIDNFVKLSDNWIAIATTQDEGNSTIRIQGVFGEDKDQKPKVQQIQRWIRVWNDHIPMITLSHDHTLQEKQKCAIEIVRCAPKRSIYIKALQSLGIVEDFGKQIVHQVVNNFKN